MGVGVGVQVAMEEGHRVGYLKSCHMEDKERTKNDGLIVYEIISI